VEAERRHCGGKINRHIGHKKVHYRFCAHIESKLIFCLSVLYIYIVFLYIYSYIVYIYMYIYIVFLYIYSYIVYIYIYAVFVCFL